MAGAFINLIVLIPFLIFAIALSKGKGAFLIAGYNTLPDSEKAQYDETAVCKFMGKIMYGICFSIFLWFLSDLLEIPHLFVMGMLLFISLIIFSLVYVNTGNRFKKE
ncbi:DUF3784 domain-containing protein [Planococcus shenhongbingii]|uniref:DUF3784 domain-containing protein n=1 Tax=Planococcus shenhongbingii TaxID=3058398 RepID=A0ABT8N8W6_9BACL|nr:DUF3784 domain-containing protein [Planococcus sp. N017]MDN7244102.1 DUF3784 domain-containing protein [Planococcus sp. N017]